VPFANVEMEELALKKFTRDTPDISEWLDFDIYDLVSSLG
jgi:hypothetical protein